MFSFTRLAPNSTPCSTFSCKCCTFWYYYKRWCTCYHKSSVLFIWCRIFKRHVGTASIVSACNVYCFMGSMLAYKEDYSKRLAYSTVSQVSYVLFGLMLFSPLGFCGAMLQILFHAVAKNILFLPQGQLYIKQVKHM